MKESVSFAGSRVGRGLAFHITPGNVPLNFAYSWVFSLLSGNGNVIKLPSKKFPQSEILISVIRDLLEDSKYKKIASSNVFIRYPRDKVITDFLSASANVRILWGGDNAIKSIQESPLRLRGIEIRFPDRISASIVNANSVLELSKIELKRLSMSFVSDAYLFDQRGCSSPKMVFWVGNKKSVAAAKEIFWSEISIEVQSKYQLEPINAMSKFVDICKLSSISDVKFTLTAKDNYLYLLNNFQLGSDSDIFQGKFGTFVEYEFQNISEIQTHVSDKFQTLTYFGFELPNLKSQIMSLESFGIDRVVPIGAAFDMDIVWDGQNFIESLSRLVEFR